MEKYRSGDNSGLIANNLEQSLPVGGMTGTHSLPANPSQALRLLPPHGSNVLCRQIHVLSSEPLAQTIPAHTAHPQPPPPRACCPAHSGGCAL